MQKEPQISVRQKPAGTVGRARDAGRDQLILDATLQLLSEHGPGAVSMEAVAAQAGVGKATVYRRWASVSDLIADAIDTLQFQAPDLAAQAQSLRDDLIEGLAGATGCMEPRRQRIVAAILEASQRQPGLTENLRARFIDAVRSAIEDAVGRAVSRGELEPTAAGSILQGPEPIELVTVVGLITTMPHMTGRPLDRNEFARIVDEALLPLLTIRSSLASQRQA